MHNARRSIKALTVFLLYINTAIHKLRIWSIPIVCHIKAGCLSFGRHGTWTSLTENKPHPPGSSLVSLSFIWSHLFFLQANTSWWWASSWPSPRSRWSAPWRWRTSRSSPGSTEGCGSWRWRTCSWCWPESRTRSGDSGHMGGGERRSNGLKGGGSSMSRWCSRDNVERSVFPLWSFSSRLDSKDVHTSTK